MPVSDTIETRIEMMYELSVLALACEARCICCGEVEFVIPIDAEGPLEANFLDQYLCDECGVYALNHESQTDGGI